MKVGVINYGVGNLGSVLKALETLKVIPLLAGNPTDLGTCDAFILPGVGNFTECMQILRTAGWEDEIKEEVLNKEKPLLGICLGMQLLAEFGNEGSVKTEGTLGLGLIPGKIRALKEMGCQIRIPHMGWNSVNFTKESYLFKGIPPGTDFYFVHSYGFETTGSKHIEATTQYGIEVAAAVGKGKIWGTQFHPEKSSRAGLKVIKNFLEIAEKC